MRGSPVARRSGMTRAEWRSSCSVHRASGRAKCAGSRSAAQGDRLLRTRRDALAAAVALVGPNREGLLAAVDRHLQSREQADRRALRVRDPADLEHVVRADAHAVVLALALVAVHDGLEDARLVLAVRVADLRHDADDATRSPGACVKNDESERWPKTE